MTWYPVSSKNRGTGPVKRRNARDLSPPRKRRTAVATVSFEEIPVVYEDGRESTWHTYPKTTVVCENSLITASSKGDSGSSVRRALAKLSERCKDEPSCGCSWHTTDTELED